MRTIHIIRALIIIGNGRIFNAYQWKNVVLQQCEDLGGIFIKFIQMLAVHESTKHWVKDVDVNLAYEQVAYEDINIEYELLSIKSNFSYICDRPFAAGSYGQVYEAELITGEKVVVKILRPSVHKTLRKDLRFLQVIARIISLFTKSSVIDIVAIQKEFAKTTIAETNYISEAKNGEKLREYFGKKDNLVIPTSYEKLCSRHILVQQFIPGISLASALSKQGEGCHIDQVVYEATGSNIWQQLTTLGKEFLTASIYADIQMVDPHPGNIRFMDNNKVALIDFGMVSKAPTNKAALVNMIGEFVKVYENRFEPGQFAVAMLAFLDLELHDALQVVARQKSSNYVDSIGSFIQDYVMSQANDSVTQHYIIERQMAKLFNQVINRGNKLGIRISKENIMLQRSMTMFLSIVRQIGEMHDGKVHFTLLHEVMSDVYSSAIINGFEQTPQPEMQTEYAFEVASNWLSVIAENDRELYGYITKRSFA
jgi:predicted unusual protein kinase regulating ubiquinone biosynthesis (AarF/ABC1/UbiB family)